MSLRKCFLEVKNKKSEQSLAKKQKEKQVRQAVCVRKRKRQAIQLTLDMTVDMFSVGTLFERKRKQK